MVVMGMGIIRLGEGCAYCDARGCSGVSVMSSACHILAKVLRCLIPVPRIKSGDVTGI